MAYSRFKNLTELVDATTRKLRQAVGAGVNIYSEPSLKAAIEDIYTLAVGDRWWPHLMTTLTRTLDGSTGVVTEDLTDIDEFTDIRAIFYNGEQRQLPMQPHYANYNAGVGAQQRCVEPLPYNHANVGRLFRVVPATTVGTLYIHARITPNQIFTNPEVVVPFNPQLLACGAAWSYAASEGINNTHVAKLQQEFADALKGERASYRDMGIVLDPRQASFPTEWQEDWRY